MKRGGALQDDQPPRSGPLMMKGWLGKEGIDLPLNGFEADDREGHVIKNCVVIGQSAFRLFQFFQKKTNLSHPELSGKCSSLH